MVNRSPLEEEDEIEESTIHPTASVKSALESLQVLSGFLSNPPADLLMIEATFLKFGA